MSAANATQVNSTQAPQQLPLAIGLRQWQMFDSFIPGANQQLVSVLKTSIQFGGERFLYLWGSSRSGKSHLLHASCELAEQLSKTRAYIPFQQIDELTTDILAGLECLELICLDDIQAIAGRSDWEHALFHLFNRLKERNRLLLVTANQSPCSLPIDLADLKTRLTWGASYQLQTLNDEEKVELLIREAQHRGMTLPLNTAKYILHHTPRSIDALHELLEELDQKSLADQRKLTIPYVRKFIVENYK